MSLNLELVMQEAISAALQSDAVKDRIQKAAEKAIDEAIAEAFNYSSKFRKQAKEVIELVMPIVSRDDLNHFTLACQEVIQKRLGSLAMETAEQHIGEMMEEMLPAKPEITIEELHEAFIKKIKDDESRHCDGDDDDYEPEHMWEVEYAKADEKIESLKRYWHLHFSPEEGDSKTKLRVK